MTLPGLSVAARPWTRIILAVLAAGLLARVVTLGAFLIYDPGFTYDNDSAGYISLAENLEAGNGFAWDVGMPFTPDSFRTPGYPVFLLAHHAVTDSFLPALITQIILSLLIAYAIILLADRFLTVRTGVIAAGVFLVMPFSLLVTVRYLTQVPFTVTVVGAVVAFLLYLSTKRQYLLWVAALLLPLAALIRPIAILFVVPFGVTLFLAALWREIPWRRAIVSTGILLVVFMAGVAPWLYRNHQVFGVASLSSLMPFQLYFYDAPSIYATAQDLSYADAKAELERHIGEVTGIPVGSEESAYYYAEFTHVTPTLVHEGLSIALADIPALIETRVVQFFKFFVRDGIRYWIERYGIDTAAGAGFAVVVIERLILAVITVGFFVAAVRGFLTRNIAVTLMALVVLYFAVLTGVMASAGLRYPAEPLFLLLGIAGIIEIIRRLKPSA